MRRVATRLVQSVPVILIVATLTFLLMHLLPGDPAMVIAGPEASPAAVERIRQQLGLDRPILEQLLVWLANIARGDFGRSLVLNQGVLAAVAQRLPVTLSLTVVSLAITVPIGVALGVLAACWRQTWLDSAIMALALLGLSVPSFWVAILSVILFSVSLHWLPTTGYAPLASGFGPWLASLVAAGGHPRAIPDRLPRPHHPLRHARRARSGLHPYRAREGPREWSTIMRHALRNSLIPVITATGIILSLLIGGSVVVEQVFALPGVGRLIVQAILARDYPIVQGTLLLLGFLFVLLNVLIDGIYTWADPRVRYG